MPVSSSSGVTCRRHARDGDRQQDCGDALASRHAMAQSLGFAESGEFAQGRRTHYALHAEGEERGQRSDGEEVAWRAQRSVMKVKPQHPPVTTAIAAAPICSLKKRSA